MISQHSINVTRLDTGEERNFAKHWNMFPATELSFQPPEPKYVYEETGGVDGSLDETENAADRVLYNNRTGSWELYITNRTGLELDISESISWADMQSDLSNFLHGQKCKIQLEDDPNYYYIGRLKISGFDPNKHYQHVNIDYEVEPYKYELDEFDSGTISVSTTSTLTSYGSPMAAIPTITVESTQFAFHQHDVLTRGEAVWMLFNMECLNAGETITPTNETTFLDVSEDDFYYDAVSYAQDVGWTSGITEYIFGGENVCTRAMFIQMLYVWAYGQGTTVTENIPFTDVKINAYYYNAVRWAYQSGLIVGDGNGHFMPNEPMTRQHACAIAYKVWNEPTYPSGTADSFTDLEGSESIYPWYYLAVVKLNNEGYVSGYSDGTFRPANYITRGQYVTMLYATAGKPSVSSITDPPFTDINSTMYCYDAVKWAYALGFISGTSSTTFSPDRVMYRKEMVQVLYLYGNELAKNNPNLEYWEITGEEDEDDSALSGYAVASDVSREAYYYIAVAWAVVHDITTLDKGARFNPDQKATRAMAAQMIYKLGKILYQWTETAEDIVPASGTSHEYRTYTGNWYSEYYDSNSNDFVSDSGYKTSAFIGCTTTSDGGTISSIRVNIPTSTQWRVHWFSSVSGTTQTLLSETSWTTGTGSNVSLSVPSGAVRFAVGLKGSSSTTTQTQLYGGTWSDGGFDTDNETWTSSTSYKHTDITTLTHSTYGKATAVICDVPTGYKFRVLWFSGTSTSNYLSRSSLIDGTGTSYNVSVTSSSATHYAVEVYNSGSSTTTTTVRGSDLTWTRGEIYNNPSAGVDTSSVYSIYSTALSVGSAESITFTPSSGYDCYVTWYSNSSISSMISMSSSFSSARTYAPPSGANYYRISLGKSGNAITTLEGSNVTATLTSTSSGTVDPYYIEIYTEFTVSSGGSVDTDDVVVQVYVTVTKDPFTDIRRYTVNYSDAICWCYYRNIIDTPMCEYAPMTVRLVNDHIDKTTEVAYGQNDVPELVVFDGENDWTVTGTGTYRIQYKRGSL